MGPASCAQASFQLPHRICAVAEVQHKTGPAQFELQVEQSMDDIKGAPECDGIDDRKPARCWVGFTCLVGFLLLLSLLFLFVTCTLPTD